MVGPSGLQITSRFFDDLLRDLVTRSSPVTYGRPPIAIPIPIAQDGAATAFMDAVEAHMDYVTEQSYMTILAREPLPCGCQPLTYAATVCQNL